MSFLLEVWGEGACFTRPEFKAERVSYDCMTPTAAQGLLKSIHWKPAMEYVIERIYVINEIKYTTFMSNELKGKTSSLQLKTAAMGGSRLPYLNSNEERQQRSNLILKDVRYVIEAHIVLTDKAGKEENLKKHYEQFERRAQKGQYFRTPYMGIRDYPAYFKLISKEEIPESYYKHTRRPIGLMLGNIDFEANGEPSFFPAEIRNGILEIPQTQEGDKGA